MDLYKQLKGNKKFCVLLLLCLLWVLLPVMAPWISSFDPYKVDMAARLQPESLVHWMGTDQLGRDEMARILYGGRSTLSVAFMTVFLTAVIGIFLGALMSLSHSWIAGVFSSILDFFLAMPVMVFTVALIGVPSPSLSHLIFALVVTGWSDYARITRTLVLEEKEKGYVRYSALAGAGLIHTIFHYILPNIIPELLVFLCQHISEVILLAAGFSLIGIGVQPPTAEWGMLLMGSRNYMQTAPWLLLYPGLAIFITIILFNLLGDLMRDALDPHEGR